ncbi:MAG: glycosidase, partial [Rhodothermales bacterium]|nr:glycosidase [Rhodothermales bacterium]
MPVPESAERSIATPPAIKLERLHGGRPVLEAREDHPWESRVVLNPAAVLIEPGEELDRLLDTWGLDTPAAGRLRGGGACVLLYRAQGAKGGEHSHAASSIGLAVLTPALELVWRRRQPVLRPDQPYQNLGVEDARCTKVGDRYYLYYTGYSTAAGGTESDRRVRICLATTEDFLKWDLRGPVAGDINEVDNKNAALFPEPVHGNWLLLHRPMSGPGAMAIHLAEAHDPAGPWTSRGEIMRSYRYREFDRSWIGAGGPPMPLGGQRFLMIYHLGHFTAEGTREYDLA